MYLMDSDRPVENFLVNGVRATLVSFLFLLGIAFVVTIGSGVFDDFNFEYLALTSVLTGMVATSILLIAFRIEARITEIRDVLIEGMDVKTGEEALNEETNINEDP